MPSGQHGRRMAVMQLTWAEVSARRLDRNHLAVPRSDDPAQVARDMGGVDAQVMSAARLSLALRVRTPQIDESGLVKTRGPRGTVHLLPAADLPMWIGALSAQPVRHPVWSAAQVDRV